MVGMRYAPSSFRHNARIGAVLLPTLVVLVGFGGKLPVGVFLAGVMVGDRNCIQALLRGDVTNSWKISARKCCLNCCLFCDPCINTARTWPHVSFAKHTS